MKETTQKLSNDTNTKNTFYRTKRKFWWWVKRVVTKNFKIDQITPTDASTPLKLLVDAAALRQVALENVDEEDELGDFSDEENSDSPITDEICFGRWVRRYAVLRPMRIYLASKVRTKCCGRYEPKFTSEISTRCKVFKQRFPLFRMAFKLESRRILQDLFLTLKYTREM